MSKETEARYRIIHADCREALAGMADCSVDSVVTDPPYELSFMSKKWDGTGIAFSVDLWREVLRVLKPGGHLLSFGGTRTYHRMVCAIEDAGFEVRDSVGFAWVYGSGFPKSLDVSKALDRAAGQVREVVGRRTDGRYAYGFSEEAKKALGGMVAAESTTGFSGDVGVITAPATDAARQWEGWGTALKPSWEPIVSGYKPLQVSDWFAVITAHISDVLEGIVEWSISNVNGAEKSTSDTQVKSKMEALSVLAPAKISVLESFDSASFALLSSIFSAQKSTDSTRTRGDSVLPTAKQSGNEDRPKESKIPLGEAESSFVLIADMYTSVITEGTSENTVSLWQSILEEVSCQASTFTIGTAIRLTTELRTLKSLLFQSILSDTGSSLNQSSSSWEPICMARKPFRGTVADCVIANGTGAINIDACRIAHNEQCRTMAASQANIDSPSEKYRQAGRRKESLELKPEGRWPANAIFSESAAAELDRQSGVTTSNLGHRGAVEIFKDNGDWRGESTVRGFSDTCGASRFFYVAKPDTAERNAATDNAHPTVKPASLLRYLVRMVTPPDGLVLDPFAGSGTTGVAALAENFRCVLIEREAEYVEICRARMRRADCADGLFAAMEAA